MKSFFYLVILILLARPSCMGQTKRVPGNLKEAVRFLHEDCPDTIKSSVKLTLNDRIKELSYPWGRSKYKTIYNWTNDEQEDSKLVRYLSARGVSYHRVEVILIAFKESLWGNAIDEDKIIKPFRDIEARWAKEDKVRFVTDSLRGVYVPRDLEDCFRQINSFWPDSVRAEVRNMSEDEFAGRYHFGFGRWMRNEWQLWGGSRLSAYFNNKGISHPDDMSGIILRSYHRSLNGKDLRLEEQIQHYKDYWKAVELGRKKEKQEAFSKYRVGDTLEYKYNLGYVSTEQERKDDEDICIARGVVTELNDEKFWIKVKLIESCDEKGIIYFDNVGYKIYNRKTKKWEKPRKRITKKMKSAQQNWFPYKDWEPKEDE